MGVKPPDALLMHGAGSGFVECVLDDIPYWRNSLRSIIRFHAE